MASLLRHGHRYGRGQDAGFPCAALPARRCRALSPGLQALRERVRLPLRPLRRALPARGRPERPAPGHRLPPPLPRPPRPRRRRAPPRPRARLEHHPRRLGAGAPRLRRRRGRRRPLRPPRLLPRRHRPHLHPRGCPCCSSPAPAWARSTTPPCPSRPSPRATSLSRPCSSPGALPRETPPSATTPPSSPSAMTSRSSVQFPTWWMPRRRHAAFRKALAPLVPERARGR